VLVGRGYVGIRPEFEGDWSRSVNARASNAGRSGASAFSKAFGAGLKGIGALAGVAIGANLSSAAAGAALIAPALTTAAGAAGALKLGLSGVGDAFKAAFADSSAQASSAASATRAVEAAQRGLANAQRALADAREQAAERMTDALQAVQDAEVNLTRTVEDAAERQADAKRKVQDAVRDLASAQREAKEVQGDLNEARREAARDLEDLTSKLANSRLEERELTIARDKALKDLQAAQAKPGNRPEDIAKLQLAYDQAAQAVADQALETKRLAQDQAAAQKAGIDGSKKVLDVQEKIADAQRDVADKTRDLNKAREDQRRTEVDAARDIADAQRSLADAQAGVDKAREDGARQIADAQRAVADAASAVADAQAAAAGQASEFDKAMAKLAPNARAFVTAVQGLGPAWTAMKLGVQNRLFEGLDSTVTTLGNTTIPVLQRQLTATAGVWNQIAKNAAGAVTEMARSGMLDQILKGATDNLAVFKNTPGQILTAFGQLSVAAQPAFNQLLTQFAGAITSFTDGIAKSFTSGGLEQAITTAFGILSQFGTLLGNVLGTVSQILKAASDAGGQIVGVLGAVFGELNKILAAPEMQAQLRTLFGAVAQIVSAIVPVIGSVVQAVVPLLAAIAPVIGQLAQALGPVLSELATALGQALMPIITALSPVITILGEAIVQIVRAVVPLLQPIGEVIGAIITALLPVLTPIIDIVVQLVQVLAGPLTRIIQSVVPWIGTLGTLLGDVFGALAPLIDPLIGIVGMLAKVFATLYGMLVEVLIDVITPLIPAFTDIVGLVVQLALQVLSSLMPSISQLIGAGMQLFTALAPLLPALAQITVMLLELAVNVLAAVLPPVIRLAGFLTSVLATALSTVIGWISNLVVWLTKNLGPAFRWLNDKVVQPVWKAIREAVRVAWEQGIRPQFAAIKAGIDGVGSVFRWLRDKVVKPVWDRVVSIITSAYTNGVKPAFSTLSSAVGRVGSAFESAVKAIKTQWDKLRGIAKAPVSFVIDTVYNAGIVGVWNKIAKAFGAPVLKEFHPKGFARGGVYDVLPGYTPGRDPHKFYSPSGLALEMSGGESIFRPEFTRAVGTDFVGAMNRIAKSGGAASVRKALAPVLGGNPRTPVDRSLRYASGGTVQAFADGGVFGWIGKAAGAVAGAGSEVWNDIKKGASWLTDTLAGSAKAGVKAVVDPLLKSFPGADTQIGQMIRRIPDKILDALFGYTKEADKKGAGGVGGPRIQAGLKWARTQDGKPYQWGGNGNPSWDCSGLVSAIESVIRGQKPHRRWATGAFHGKTAPPGWVLHGNSPYRIGVTNSGVGHTAGTISGVNVESRGGDGVVIGKRARGYKDKLFTDWYGFQPGKYDQGGWMPPGWAYNGLKTPEAVFTPQQYRVLEGAAAAGVAAGQGSSVTYEINARTADFTVADLARVQRVQEARARVGRPR
jgi:phage-related protein